MRDAVIHTELSLLTGGAITTDNVDDDNGTRITDGQMGTVAAFPYIGATFGLDDAAAALRYVADGKAVGKVVVDVA